MWHMGSPPYAPADPYCTLANKYTTHDLHDLKRSKQKERASGARCGGRQGPAS